MKIQKNGLLVILVFVAVIAILFLFVQKNNNKVAKDENVVPTEKIVSSVSDENIIPEWETYTHTYGYTIEYPKNILPSIRFGDAPNVTFFYKTSYEETPHIVVRISASRGMSVPEWYRTIPTATLNKVSIPNINVDAYVVNDSLQSPDITDVQLVKDGVLYRINIAGLPQALTDHIMNSFHINFVPASMKLY